MRGEVPCRAIAMTKQSDRDRWMVHVELEILLGLAVPGCRAQRLRHYQAVDRGRPHGSGWPAPSGGSSSHSPASSGPTSAAR